MVENDRIQMKGFHNIYDKNGKAVGFQFCFHPGYYKGMWLSQVRTGDLTVDDEVFPKDTLVWNLHGMDYTAEEMYDLMDIYWDIFSVATIKVKKPGGLSKGYHDIDLRFGWVCNYNSEPEKEFDGSGLGNAIGLFGSGSQRRLLLVR